MTSKSSQSVSKRSLLRRGTRYASASLLLGGTLVGSGCLDRPVGVSRPVTTNVVVQRQINNAINAIDLLLMIDNSSSMADKQKTLADAVPQLLTQLVQPACVNEEGVVSGRVELGTGQCPSGGSPEFNPVNNIHIGIVSSSLGDHGGDNLCTPGKQTSFTDPTSGNVILEPPDVNDQGHLMGTLQRYMDLSPKTSGTERVTIDGTGFLAWGNSTKPAMTGTDLTAATGVFKDMVSATREMGCGLEAQLEGWFRFLIDPVPPRFPITKNDAQQAQRIGSDDDLLAQRRAFLRPDSLVAILMLTDENDCSLRDTDVGWVATDTRRPIATGSVACAQDPNSNCCYSCTTGGPKECGEGCPNGTSAAVDDTAFQANIRCWHQKRRFGYEFMYPVSRYVVGLTKPVLCPDQSFGDMDCDCDYAKSIGAACDPGKRQLPNPLYSTIVGKSNDNQDVQTASEGAMPRTDNSAIFLAGIVGVPWQDIGYLDRTQPGNPLVYIPVTDSAWTGQPSNPDKGPTTPVPAQGGIWANIYGDDNANKNPADPHMIESIEKRDGITAYDNIEHEWNTAYMDLEYACIYPLPEARKCACDPANANTYASCKYQNPNDCCDLTFQVNGRGDANSAGEFNKPLCNSNTQVNAKGYPGLREIAVLHDYATQGATQGNSIVASICPQNLTNPDKADPGYGYNPAVAALVNRLKEKLKGSCLPRPLSVNTDSGQVPCNVVEVVGSATAGGTGDACSAYCAGQGRNVGTADNPSGQVSPQMQAAVLDSMRKSGLCDKAGAPACADMCMCLLPQEPTGDALNTCQSADEGTVNRDLPPGYCYIDPALGLGTEALVKNCPSTQKRILRFVGNNPTGGGHSVPLNGALVFTACQGSSLNQ